MSNSSTNQMSGLADMYDLKDENQAKEYLEKVGIEYRFQCYHENRPDGCQRLGDYLDNFVKQTDKARIVYTKNCIENKYGASCHKMGNFNMLGHGGPKNVDEAYEYYKKGCESNYGSSCYNAAAWCSNPNYGKGDMVSANRYLEKGCDAKDAQSCNLLGGYYIKGTRGVPQDFEKAFKFSMKACELGNIYGCGNVSIMYKNGDGVRKNLESSEQFKERAKQMHAAQTEHSQTLTFGQ